MPNQKYLLKQRILIAVLIFSVLFSISATAQKTKKSEDADSAKRVTFAAIPMVNYNLTFGFMAGAMGSVFYKINPNDTVSPSSSTMLMGMFSTSKTYMLLGVQQLYFKQDKWRIKFAVGTGEVFFQYFQDLPNLGDGYWDENGIWIDFSTDVSFFYTDLKRQVIPNFYAGVEGSISLTTTEFDIENPSTGEKLTSNAEMNSLGYNFLFDNRDNVNFPTSGFFVQYKNGFIREWMGSSNNFERYELAFNHFWDINSNNKSILVSRLFADIAAGDVPFQGENFVGRDDLRGYSKGRYRGNQIYTVQTELRQNIYKKFGMIGFVGMGTAVSEISEMSNSEFLPSVGLGLRYLMIPKEKINIGIDVGLGKDDWSLAFRIGETFGR